MRRKSWWSFTSLAITVVAFVPIAWVQQTRDRKLEYVKAHGGEILYDGPVLCRTCDVFWANCGVTDDALENLTHLRNLRILVVSGNPLVTDAGLKRIGTSKSDIEILDVSDTGISRSGVLDFLQKKPSCDVSWRGQFWSKGAH